MIKNAIIAGRGINSDKYHAQNAKRGTPDFVMSSSSLRNFAQCPRRYLAGYEPPASDAKDFGSLLDCRLLTPDQFGTRYAVKPPTYQSEKGETKPWNGNSNTCKAWLDDHAHMEIVSAAELERCDAAIKRLREDETICSFLDGSDKQVHIKAEWHDEATGLVVPVQALLDLVPRPDTEWAQCIGDLKTTRNASLMAWQRWCFQAQYHVQTAFFLDLLALAEGGADRNTVCFILSENYPPWETAKRMLNQDFVLIGRNEYQRMLGNYCACLKHNRWPSYDDTDEAVQGWGLIAAEPWMQERTMFAPKYEFGEEVPANEAEEARNDDIIP